MGAPFDAVLIVAFGGPQGLADVRPFLANVLRGRRVSPERIDEVAHHYERFGGVSPLTELTRQQARALEAALASRGVPLAAQRSYSGCTQYRENVRDAREALIAKGLRPPDVVYVGDWHEHPGFVAANAEHVRRAYEQLPPEHRTSARLIFTAHSIPMPMAERYPYEAQLQAAARLIAAAVGQ